MHGARCQDETNSAGAEVTALLRDELQPDAAAAFLRRKKASTNIKCGTTVNKS